MDTKLFDGKALAQKIEAELKSKNKTPKLVSILVGDNPASVLFLSLKQKAAERVGAILEIKRFGLDTPQEELIHFIKALNSDKSVNGIMIQLPLPDGFDKEMLIGSISPEKDVDGMREGSLFVAPVVLAIWTAIKESAAEEKSATIVGAKGFVGKKLTAFLNERNFKTVLLDIGSSDLAEKVKDAGLIISATGSQGLIKGDMIKDGAKVIDVGSPRGDVRTEEVIGRASFLSPVPGGVGPLTIAYLMANLLQ